MKFRMHLCGIRSFSAPKIIQFVENREFFDFTTEFIQNAKTGKILTFLQSAQLFWCNKIKENQLKWTLYTAQFIECIQNNGEHHKLWKIAFTPEQRWSKAQHSRTTITDCWTFYTFSIYFCSLAYFLRSLKCYSQIIDGQYTNWCVRNWRLFHFTAVNKKDKTLQCWCSLYAIQHVMYWISIHLEQFVRCIRSFCSECWKLNTYSEYTEQVLNMHVLFLNLSLYLVGLSPFRTIRST